MEALKLQTLVSGDAELAAALMRSGELQYHKTEECLMEQGKEENDIFLIISGEVSIRVNNRHVASRSAGTHVGEMALVDPVAKRSATVTATEATVSMKIPEHRFSQIAESHPDLWRRIAVEVSKRLRERNKLLRQPHNEPVLFIGSSAEGLQVASDVFKDLSRKPVVVKLWSQGVFAASRTSIESLVTLAQDADFAALVLTADDVTVSRGRRSPSPRDNVIFELGLFMGALGRERVFILKPKGLNVRIPTDLLGVTWLEYGRAGRVKGRTRVASKTMFSAIRALGPR